MKNSKEKSKAEHFIANVNNKGKGFVIKDNSFGDHRASSIKNQSTNRLIEGNETSHIKNYGFYFCACMNWFELCLLRNITIRNNKVNNYTEFSFETLLPTGTNEVNVRPIMVKENNTVRNLNTTM